MLAGMLLAILTYRPIFDRIYQLTDTANKQELVDQYTTRQHMEFDDESGDSLQVTTINRSYTDGSVHTVVQTETQGQAEFSAPTVTEHIHVGSTAFASLVSLVFVLVLYVTMVYGPIAAFLVEMFPVRIRYTSMSLPYHIGNGIFGGLLPAVATYLVAKAQFANDGMLAAGNALRYEKPHLEGLWYPIIIAGVSFIIGLFYIKNKNQNVQ